MTRVQSKLMLKFTICSILLGFSLALTAIAAPVSLDALPASSYKPMDDHVYIVDGVSPSTTSTPPITPSPSTRATKVHEQPDCPGCGLPGQGIYTLFFRDILADRVLIG